MSTPTHVSWDAKLHKLRRDGIVRDKYQLPHGAEFVGFGRLVTPNQNQNSSDPPRVELYHVSLRESYAGNQGYYAVRLNPRSPK